MLCLKLLTHFARQGEIEKFLHGSGIFETLNPCDKIKGFFLGRFVDRTIHGHSGFADIIYLGCRSFIHFEIARQDSAGPAAVCPGVEQSFERSANKFFDNLRVCAREFVPNHSAPLELNSVMISKRDQLEKASIASSKIPRDYENAGIDITRRQRGIEIGLDA